MNLDPVRAEKTLTIWQDFNGTRLKGSFGTSETTAVCARRSKGAATSASRPGFTIDRDGQG